MLSLSICSLQIKGLLVGWARDACIGSLSNLQERLRLIQDRPLDLAGFVAYQVCVAHFIGLTENYNIDAKNSNFGKDFMIRGIPHGMHNNFQLLRRNGGSAQIGLFCCISAQMLFAISFKHCGICCKCCLGCYGMAAVCTHGTSSSMILLLLLLVLILILLVVKSMALLLEKDCCEGRTKLPAAKPLTDLQQCKHFSQIQV